MPLRAIDPDLVEKESEASASALEQVLDRLPEERPGRWWWATAPPSEGRAVLGLAARVVRRWGKGPGGAADR